MGGGRWRGGGGALRCISDRDVSEIVRPKKVVLGKSLT